jgi:hypothetical protein
MMRVQVRAVGLKQSGSISSIDQRCARSADNVGAPFPSRALQLRY